MGLFDEATAMERFTKWTNEHDNMVAQRQSAHKKASMDRRNPPVVKKVEVKAEPVVEAAPEVEAVPEVEAPAETATDAPASEE
jgi:small subunit ribosomal protein S16